MNRTLRVAAVLAFAMVLAGWCVRGLLAADPPATIDWQKAKLLYQKSQSGQSLTADEQAYVDAAKKAMAAGQGPNQANRAAQPGQPGGDQTIPGTGEKIDWARIQQLRQKEKANDPMSDEDKAYLARIKELVQSGKVRPPAMGGPTSRPMAAQGPLTPKETTGLKPLTEMSADDKYQGEDGGLYGGGSNDPPKEHAAAAARELAKIEPLGADGKPGNDGKIVLVSMGMSNTTNEFSVFKRLADADADKSPQLVIVDCAQGGQAALQWNGEGGKKVWAEAEKRIKAAGVTPEQVQVIFLKQALIGPSHYGDFPVHAKELQKQVVGNLQLARQHFPNVKVAYLTSRIYGGYATSMLNPEPYAYEGAFAFRWVIQDQIKGEKALNFDPAKGDVKSPLLLWGPYLWADGMTPRKSDGLVYKREDLANDGTHPSPETGRPKVAAVILKFFKTDPLAKGWFLKAGSGQRQ